MAVPKKKTSPSRRGMRRSADALKRPTYMEDKDSGELRRPHHIDLKTGMYRGRQVLKAKKDYWGGGPSLDEIQFIDLGDDPAAAVSALASKQVDGLYGADIVQLDALQKLPHVQMYQVTTAYTATARVQPVKPFDDKRVRQALRYAIDSNVILQISHKGLGQIGEHHHVSPVHPEYAKLPAFQRDVAKAKKLLADAGYPNGIDTEIKHIKAGGADAQNAIQSYTADIGADFMVMGGYHHSRLREFILGGVTRGILKSMTVPVFMSR